MIYPVRPMNRSRATKARPRNDKILPVGATLAKQLYLTTARHKGISREELLAAAMHTARVRHSPIGAMF
jgi:hypothetical protein